MAFGGELHLAELPALRARNAVVLRQPAVEHGEVGVHEVGQAQVVLQNFLEEEFGFPEHRHLEHVVEFGVEDVAWLGEIDLAQVQPLADEVLGEGRRLGVLEQGGSSLLCARDVRVAQFAFFGEGEQFLVGQGAPEEVRQPAGQSEVVEFARLLAEKQELRRHHDRHQADAQKRLLEGLFLGQLGFDELRRTAGRRCRSPAA